VGRNAFEAKGNLLLKQKKKDLNYVTRICFLLFHEVTSPQQLHPRAAVVACL